jgi:hypothetical protein
MTKNIFTFPQGKMTNNYLEHGVFTDDNNTPSNIYMSVPQKRTKQERMAKSKLRASNLHQDLPIEINFYCKGNVFLIKKPYSSQLVKSNTRITELKEHLFCIQIIWNTM